MNAFLLDSGAHSHRIPMLLECTRCEALVDAVVVSSYVITGNCAPSFLCTFAKCPSCNSPFLATQEEDIDDDWRAPQRLYPDVEPTVGIEVPPAIRLTFGEARTCFKARAYTAAAVMCRKALEGICAAHEVRERSLAQSLQLMRDRGIIEQRLYQWADALRIVGNDAAHGVDVAISADDASDTLEFTKALLEYVFTFREKFEAFSTRRRDRKTTATFQPARSKESAPPTGEE